MYSYTLNYWKEWCQNIHYQSEPYVTEGLVSNWFILIHVSNSRSGIHIDSLYDEFIIERVGICLATFSHTYPKAVTKSEIPRVS